MLLALMFVASLATAQSFSQDDFFKAARHNNVRDLQAMLKQGMDPNLSEPTRGETALMHAVRENSQEAVKLLIEAKGINLDLRAKNGDTALMVAAFKKNKSAAAALLAKGARANQDGWTALHYAAWVGDVDIIDMLLKKSAQVDAPSPNGTTPLMMAARGGHIHAVKALLDAGADPNLLNEHQMNALAFAREGNHQDIVDGLISRAKKAEQRAAEAERQAAEQRNEQAKKLTPPNIDGRLPRMD